MTDKMIPMCCFANLPNRKSGNLTCMDISVRACFPTCQKKLHKIALQRHVLQTYNSGTAAVILSERVFLPLD